MEINDLTRFNSHWQTLALPKAKHKIRRKLFNRIALQLSSRFALSIQGLRRTGKSVLMDQLVEEYCHRHKEIAPDQILRFSFEREDDLDLLPPSELSTLLDLYFRNVLKEHPQSTNRKVLFALDEIQNVRGWQNVIKSYYDLNENFKFLLTGSSSLYLTEGGESLAGRILDHHLSPLDFEEFLTFIGAPFKLPFVNSLVAAVKLPTPFFITADILKSFEDFLLLGGFPDAALMYKAGQQTIDVQAYLRESIILKIIKRDLRKYFQLKNSFADERLMQICCNDSGTFLEINNLSRELGVSAITIKKHLEIFQKTGLINFLSKFDKKLRREIAATKKVYVTSPCLMYSMLKKPNCEDPAFLGHAAETYAYQKLAGLNAMLFVERGRETDKEVDFYLPDERLLLESKYSSRLERRHFEYLNNRADALKHKPLILSQESWECGGIPSVPVFLI